MDTEAVGKGKLLSEMVGKSLLGKKSDNLNLDSNMLLFKTSLTNDE
jgi:hypothetical protein